VTRIVIIGEAWGRDEAPLRRPFIGASGRLLNQLLEEAGLLPLGSARRISPAYSNFLHHVRDEIYDAAGIHLTNVLNLHPPGNKIVDLCGPRWGNFPPIRPGKYLREEFTSEIDRLQSELVDHKPNLILGLGATSVWFGLGTSQIGRFRGAIAPSSYGKFLPTYHPAFLLRGAWDLRPVVIQDLFKAAYEADFPEVRRPARTIYVPETLDEIEFCLRECALASRISIDVETVADQITSISFAWSSTVCCVIPIFKGGYSYWPHDEPAVWRFIARFCALPAPKVGQNFIYDMRFLWERYGITVRNVADDTMLLHHALQPELQKGLAFLGSIYTNEPSWKPRYSKSGTVKHEDA
jgi:uracil-DNA glycosylase